MRTVRKDISGLKYGRLLVIGYNHTDKGRAMLAQIEAHYKANTDRLRIRDEPVNGAYLAVDKGKLTRYAYRMLGDPQAAEDAVQDCYERVLRYKDSYKNDRDFDNWVFIILARVVNRLRAGLTNEPELIEADDSIHIEEYLIEAESPEESVDLLRWEATFNSLCLKLSQRDVSILQLYFLYGHTMPVVAEILEVNIHTVKRVINDNRKLVLGSNEKMGRGNENPHILSCD